MVTKSRGFLGRDDPWRRHLDTGNSDAGPCKSGLKPCPWRKPAAPRDSVSRPLSQPTSGAESGETCPPRPDRWHLDKDQVPPREGCEEPPSPSEQQVARDTEEVFRSYVFYLHHQEQETQERCPANPEMDNLSLEPNSVLGQVGRQLALIGDDINRRYDTEFQNLLEQLQPTAGNAYELFTKIASSLFKSGISWGRVVALLGFGYRLALYVYQRGLTGFLGQVTCFLADIILRHYIARWIAQRGGWVAALNLRRDPILIVMTIFGVVVLGQFVIHRFFRS